MMHLKKLIYKIIFLCLNLAADALIKANQIIARLYAKFWGQFDLPWFDHRYDYLRGPRHWMWTERGIIPSLYIKPTDRVLDIACGDGIYSSLFYSRFADQVDAIDRNPKAILLAQAKNTSSNVHFSQRDVLLDQFPHKNYDVIIMYAAIEHFSQKQGHEILQRIASSLKKSDHGTLIGSTPIFKAATGHGHPEHDNEFTSITQLKSFLKPHFGSITIHLSTWGIDIDRTDAYFICQKPKK